MNLSYWDKNLLDQEYDLVVVGGGFTGCFTALFYARAHPGSRIAVLYDHPREAASRRNAGFLCYGSITELCSIPDKDLVSLVERRYEGMCLMLDTLGGEHMEYVPCGGREFFPLNQEEIYKQSIVYLSRYNDLMSSLHGNTDNFWVDAGHDSDGFYIDTPLEGRIQPARAHNRLLRLCDIYGIQLYSNHRVVNYRSGAAGSQVTLQSGELVNCIQLVLATNGLSAGLYTSMRRPVRNQVLVTEPIEHALIDRVYHHDAGYVYYRPLVGGRILIGGARNKFSPSSETDVLEEDKDIQTHLLNFLEKHVTYGVRPKIYHSWSGILAMDQQEYPQASRLKEGIVEISGMNGMGVALSSLVAREAVNLLSTD